MKKLTVLDKLQPALTVEVQDDLYAVVKGHVWHLYHEEPVLLYTEGNKIVVKSLVSMLAKFHKQDPTWAHTAEPNRYTLETLRTERPTSMGKNRHLYKISYKDKQSGKRIYQHASSVQAGFNKLQTIKRSSVSHP